MAHLKDINEIRDEGFAFWSGVLPWPVDTPEHLFLGRVVNLLGEARFHAEWRPDDMVELFLPKFQEGVNYLIEADSYEDIYLKSVVEAVEKRHGQKLAPLEAYWRFVAHDRTESMERVRTVLDMMIRAFVSGQLKAFKQKIGGGTPFEEMPWLEWTKDTAHDRFLFCHDGSHAQPPSRLKGGVVHDRSGSFIFVQRASFQAFMKRWGDELFWYELLEPSPRADEVAPNAVEDIEEDISTASALATSDSEGGTGGNGLRLSSTEQDISDAIQALWPNAPHPKSQGQLQAAVNDYLKRELHYKKVPDPKTYQRYFRKIRTA